MKKSIVDGYWIEHEKDYSMLIDIDNNEISLFMKGRKPKTFKFNSDITIKQYQDVKNSIEIHKDNLFNLFGECFNPNKK